MDLSLVIPAFIAGILTFLAPCTLPLVPGYLAFISGSSLEDLKNPTKSKKVRLNIFFNGLFFIIGFSAVFILFGTLAGFIGSVALAPYRLWLGRLGGIFIIVFGFFMLNVLKIPFFAIEKTFKPVKIFERGRYFNSFIFGSAFASGWTPCVGPILGSVLLLASTSNTVLQGGFLLSVFSLGLAVPFLTVALVGNLASKGIERFSKYLHLVSIFGGLFLILLGSLMLTGKMPLLISYAYRLLYFINYERLLDYL